MAEKPIAYSITASIGEDIEKIITLVVDPRVHKQTLSLVGRGAIST